MNDLKSLLTPLLASFCFAVLFRVPRRYLLEVMLIGCLTYWVKEIGKLYVGLSYATMGASMVVGIVGAILARHYKQPAQLFILPAVIFLVPGIYIYNAIRHFMSAQTSMSAAEVLHIFYITLSISSGLLIANWIRPTNDGL
jgi:uncharacterized membrane protein YjjB (DUF3815 family)